MNNYYKNQLEKLKVGVFLSSIVVTDGHGNATDDMDLNLESIPVVIDFLKSIQTKQHDKLIDKRVDEIKDLPDVVKFLLDSVCQDHDYKRDYFYLDECGLLMSSRSIDLPEILHKEDTEVVERLIGDYFSTIEVRGDNALVTECYGEPVIFNASPERNHYAIYSNELKLRIDSVVDERHGFLIIERAFRQHGIYANIISTSRYGVANTLSMPQDIVGLSDEDLAAEIEKIENGEDDE